MPVVDVEHGAGLAITIKITNGEQSQEKIVLKSQQTVSIAWWSDPQQIHSELTWRLDARYLTYMAPQVMIIKHLKQKTDIRFVVFIHEGHEVREYWVLCKNFYCSNKAALEHIDKNLCKNLGIAKVVFSSNESIYNTTEIVLPINVHISNEEEFDQQKIPMLGWWCRYYLNNGELHGLRGTFSAPKIGELHERCTHCHKPYNTNDHAKQQIYCHKLPPCWAKSSRPATVKAMELVTNLKNLPIIWGAFYLKAKNSMQEDQWTAFWLTECMVNNLSGPENATAHIISLHPNHNIQTKGREAAACRLRVRKSSTQEHFNAEFISLLWYPRLLLSLSDLR
ncbi:hypothetical protein DFP72DRAFT_853934 [Ephemerocybe angulata]|uniref:Uncharacterized protein n=1 Tax=Ephemerocybe angulata TaxID=980116 RepID=A0A8H6HJK6_9AGAR|nr:hypothetical protein DFP72DRAFT_853934 [Tulosesus angulatus]